MKSEGNYEYRKVEHVEICLRDDITYGKFCDALFNEMTLVHQALPGLKYSEIDLSTEFLNYELNAPLVIEAITGGHPQLKSINEGLAHLAHDFKIAIGVGSQRPLIKSNFNDEILETYRVVREIAHDVPLIGNIGIAQLRDLDTNVARKIVESIKADALAIHLNPAQELIQPEGDRDFEYELLDKTAELVRELGVPLIIKEVGNGLSMEVVKAFTKIGVRAFDVAGACGTNWAMVEALRNPENTDARSLGLVISQMPWGIPTPLSVIETRAASPNSTVIASGGLWDGIKAAKTLAVGGDLAGFARPILKNLLERGYEGAKKFLEKYILELKAVMFLTGARAPKELCKKPIVLGPNMIHYLSSRGIDADLYIKETRCGASI
ncbi:MAG: type 2 isopentenyl-diphosphate Delta-isomerase [Desulfurococcaceae archaeon]